MFRDRTPDRRLAPAVWRFAPLSLLLAATVAAAVTSAVTAPHIPRARTTTDPHHSVGTPAAPVPTVPMATTWVPMVSGLGFFADSVSCASITLCVFAGGSAGSGHYLAVSASKGPFRAGQKITGHSTVFDHVVDPFMATPQQAVPHLSCPSAEMCLLLTPQTLYATGSPLTGPWVQELSASGIGYFSGISCASTTFCAVTEVIHGADARETVNNVLISTSPLGGAGTWSASQIVKGWEYVSAISCPSPNLCVAGINYSYIGGGIEVSTNPMGGPAAWSGGTIPPASPPVHTGANYITGVLCPTTTFCVADTADQSSTDVSTDPAGGSQMWHLLSGSFPNQVVAWCATDRGCHLSGSFAVQSFPGRAANGVLGNPPDSTSCVTPSFCVSIELDNLGNELLVTGGVSF